MGFLQNTSQVTGPIGNDAALAALRAQFDKQFGAASNPPPPVTASAADPASAAVPPPTNAQPGQPIDVGAAGQASLPEMAGPIPAHQNFLQRLGIDVNGPGPGTGQGGRRSVLDILGRIADVGATIGGTPALYQSSIDANTARGRATQANDWQEKFNTQKFAKGTNELQADQNTQTGQAVRGLTAVYGEGGPEGDARLAKAFPIIAQQLGMKPEESQALFTQIQADPKGTLAALGAALDPATKTATSPSADAQMYALLKSSGHPELADKFLANKADPGNVLTAKDRLMIGIQTARLGNDTRKTNAYVAANTPVPAGPGGGTGGMTPEALDYAAKIYQTDHKLPPLGQGKAAVAVRAAIINRAEQLARGGGDVHDNPGMFGANFKANASGLAQLQRTSNQILAAERTANSNADQVLQTMTKGAGNSGIPVLNKWIQAGRRSVQGDPDVSAFDAAVSTFSTEYARVVSGATGGNVTSDSARHEAQALINGAQTPAQLTRVIQQMRVEMQNRRNGFTEQAAELRGNMKLPGRATQAHANYPIMTPEQVRAAPKGTKYRTVDGRVGTRP